MLPGGGRCLVLVVLFDMKLELDMMSGLVFIHGVDEKHRDLKPANGKSSSLILFLS